MKWFWLVIWPIIASIIGTAVYVDGIPAVAPFVPRIPLGLYNIAATIFVVLFTAGLGVVVWQVFASTWRHLTNADLRRGVWDNVRKWPNNKWDLLPVIAVSYLIAVLAFMLGMILVLPKGRLAAAMSPGEFSAIFLFALAPMLIPFGIVVSRFLIETYTEIRLRWSIGTRRDRVKLAVGLSFLLVLWVVFYVGYLAGWDDSLWFNSG